MTGMGETEVKLRMTGEKGLAQRVLLPKGGTGKIGAVPAYGVLEEQLGAQRGEMVLGGPGKDPCLPPLRNLEQPAPLSF